MITLFVFFVLFCSGGAVVGELLGVHEPAALIADTDSFDFSLCLQVWKNKKQNTKNKMHSNWFYFCFFHHWNLICLFLFGFLARRQRWAVHMPAHSLFGRCRRRQHRASARQWSVAPTAPNGARLQALASNRW